MRYVNTLRTTYIAGLSRAFFQVPSRVILGGLLLVAGILKVPETEMLAWEIDQYLILPPSLVDPFAGVLPLAEIVLGLLLLLGVYTRVTGFFSGLLTLSFTIAKLKAQIQGLDIEVCPCLGPLVPLFLGPSLAIDAVMLVCAFVLVAGRSEFLALSTLFARRRGGDRIESEQPPAH